jgi:hypothetical protein
MASKQGTATIKLLFTTSGRKFYMNLQVEEIGGLLKRSWLRHYATSRKVTGSIPDEVIGFF